VTIGDCGGKLAAPGHRTLEVTASSDRVNLLSCSAPFNMRRPVQQDLRHFHEYVLFPVHVPHLSECTRTLLTSRTLKVV
jgi:hypothetical protein